LDKEMLHTESSLWKTSLLQNSMLDKLPLGSQKESKQIVLLKNHLLLIV
jgi:hypothetical protein